MKNSTEGVVYLLRKTNMTLPDIKQLEVKQFKSILDEVSYQEQIIEYNTAYRFATLLAAIVNTVPRKGGRTYSANDFLTMKKPRRATSDAPDEKAELEALAKKFDIRLPSRELKEL